jgi:hypothetical protein
VTVEATPGGQASGSVVVEDLRCTCCARDVLEAVRALEGVRSARLDYQDAVLRVEYDLGADR